MNRKAKRRWPFVQASADAWDEFWENVPSRPEAPDACWLYTGPVDHPRKPNSEGYVYIRQGARQVSVHIFMEEQTLGRSILPGKLVDHLCHLPTCNMRKACLHRICVRPSHLAESLPVENLNAERKVASVEKAATGTATDSDADLVTSSIPGYPTARVLKVREELEQVRMRLPEGMDVPFKIRDAVDTQVFDLTAKAYDSELDAKLAALYPKPTVSLPSRDFWAESHGLPAGFSAYDVEKGDFWHHRPVVGDRLFRECAHGHSWDPCSKLYVRLLFAFPPSSIPAWSGLPLVLELDYPELTLHEHCYNSLEREVFGSRLATVSVMQRVMELLEMHPLPKVEGEEEATVT